MSRFELYFSADEIRAALRELGPPGALGEGTVATAAQILADLIEYHEPEFDLDDEEVAVGWRVDHYLDPAAARQAGRPHVVIERVGVREP